MGKPKTTAAPAAKQADPASAAADVVATAATHPEATDRVWPGTYGGIRLSQGPASVTYSDGTQA